MRPTFSSATRSYLNPVSLTGLFLPAEKLQRFYSYNFGLLKPRVQSTSRRYFLSADN
ncbi:hypothetical protein EMIT093MI4_40239 [Pseudomonas sp. IT-93MI4]